MENKMIGVAAIVLAVAAIAVSAGAVVIANDDDSHHGEHDHMIPIYRYCIGCGTMSDSEVDAAKTAIENLIINEYHSGFTYYDGAKGASWDEAHHVVVVDAHSIIYEIAFISDQTARSLLHDIGEIPGLAVLMEQYYANAELHL